MRSLAPAFWHFDDFSWGATRKVDGESTQDDHSKREGEFDPSKVPFLHVQDWLQMMNGHPSAVEPLSGVAKPSLPPVTLISTPDTAENGWNLGLDIESSSDGPSHIESSSTGYHKRPNSSKLRRKKNSISTRGQHP